MMFTPIRVSPEPREGPIPIVASVLQRVVRSHDKNLEFIHPRKSCFSTSQEYLLQGFLTQR